MTLHWWMHWFWVTANFAIIIGAPSTTTTTSAAAAAAAEQLYQNDEAIKPMFVTKILPPSSLSEIKISISSTTIIPFNSNENNNNNRNAKAIYSNEPSRKKNNGNLAGPDVQKESSISSKSNMKYRHTTTTTTTSRYQFLPTIPAAEFPEEFEMQNDGPGVDEPEDSLKIKTIKKTEFLWIESTTSGPKKQPQNYDNDDLTVLPLGGFKEEEEEEEETEVNLVVNKSTVNKEKVSFSRQTINKSESIVFVSPSVSPILQASIEKLNRNDDVFSSHFDSVVGAQDRSFNININENNNNNDDDVINGESQLGGGGGDDDDDDGNHSNHSRSAGFTTFDIAAIAGSCLAMFVLISSIASFGFLMYRRKYLNPPQTLNSDKCSNPDSSGYIDDSTIRDNSEEMYSLDNDSFLNSLEAMTIQNYWTDSVKHTKL